MILYVLAPATIILIGVISIPRSSEQDLTNSSSISYALIPEVGAQAQEVVGCPGLWSGVAWATRPLFKQDPVSDVNTHFKLSTRSQRELVNLNETGPIGEVLSMDRPIYVIVHGFLSDAAAGWIKEMADALLDREDAHVLAVDWGGGANTWRYWKAVANARVASAAVAKMLQEVEGLDPERVHCIGHSLGAHVCSFVAKKLGGIGRVTGLDPAQPCFRPDDKNMRLARQDARFVDVIHTNGQSLLRLGLGLPDPIGHADFYLNGGKSQPGCSSGSIFIPSTIKRTVCSHGRAYMFFTESLKEANCSFWGHLWDRKKDSVEEALSKPCTIETCSQMGLEAERYPAQGSFYVQTEEQSPFCVSRPDVDAAMTQELSKSNSAIPKT